MAVNRKQVVLLAAIICILFIIAGTLVSVQLAKHRHRQCELIGSIPTTDLDEIRNIPSKEADAIANFAGYLHYENDYNPAGKLAPRTILPLILEDFDYDPSVAHLAFMADCSHINMSYAFNYQTNAYDIFLIEVGIRSIWNGKFAEFCYIKPKGISVTLVERYACHVTIRYPCYQMRKDEHGKDYEVTVAWLAVDNLEIEIGGSSESHQNGEFSKPEKLCLGSDMD